MSTDGIMPLLPADRYSELMSLTKRRAALYTMGDSSSIRIEVARELMQSITYTIGEYTDNDPSKSLEELFVAGQKSLMARLEYARQLMTELSANISRVTSIAYRDTVTALRDFFRRYDAQFMSHEIPCDIDYQLCVPIGDKQGVEFIIEYLCRIIDESKLLNAYPERDVKRVLLHHDLSYNESIVSLMEPILANIIAHKLLYGDASEILLSKSSIAELESLLTILPSPRLEFLACAPDTPYMQAAAHQLWPRVETALTGGDASTALSHIFTFCD